MEKVKIKLTDWDYECGDGCCTDYGVEIEVNGVTCEDSNTGDNVEQAVGFVLKTLGIDFEFI